MAAGSTAAISAYEHDLYWQLAFGLVAGMRKSVLAPGVNDLHAAFSACETFEQWLQALGTWSPGVLAEGSLVPDVNL